MTLNKILYLVVINPEIIMVVSNIIIEISNKYCLNQIKKWRAI